MNILLISYYYLPMNNGGVQRPLKMKKYLDKMGHNVYILTHNYNNFYDVKGNEIRVYDINKISFHKYLYYPLRILQKIMQFFSKTHQPKSSWFNNIKRFSNRIYDISQPDIIITTYPSIQAIEAGIFFSKKYNIPLITDFRDGLVFESIEAQALNNKLLKYYKEIENEVIKISDAIVTVSPYISQYFRDAYGVNYVHTIPNGFDSEDFYNLHSNNEVDKSFNKDDFNIVYTGRFSFSDSGTSVECFFKAFANILSDCNDTKKNVKIHLFGEFSEEEKLYFKPFLDSKNLYVHGLLTRSEVLFYQKNADLLLLITNQQRKSVATGKIFEYLIAQKPIFALAKGVYAGEIVNDTQSGWVVDGDDINEIKKVLKDIITDKSYYNNIKPNLKKIEMFSREIQVSHLNKIIDDIINKKS